MQYSSLTKFGIARSPRFSDRPGSRNRSYTPRPERTQRYFFFDRDHGIPAVYLAPRDMSRHATSECFGCRTSGFRAVPQFTRGRQGGEIRRGLGPVPRHDHSAELDYQNRHHDQTHRRQTGGDRRRALLSRRIPRPVPGRTGGPSRTDHTPTATTRRRRPAAASHGLTSGSGAATASACSRRTGNSGVSDATTAITRSPS